MPSPDPKGRGAAVALTIAAPQREFLRGTVAHIRAALIGDLQDRRDQLEDPERSELEAAVWAELLKGLLGPGRRVVVTEGMRDQVEDLRKAIDEDNEYDRAVAEHDALAALVAQLGPKGQG